MVNLATHLNGLVLVVNKNLACARNAAATHTASNNGCVAGHTTASGEDTLCYAHTAKVLRRSLKANQDDFLVALCPCLGVVGKEYDVAGSSTRTCRKTLSNNLGSLHCRSVKYWVEKLIEFLRLHALENSLLVNLALTQQVHGNLHHSSAGALAVTCL